jgi:Fe-S-cluster containining protein
MLEEYQKLLENLDKKCDEVYGQMPFIPCKKGCSDCCKQFFPVSFIEAAYINKGIKELSRQKRRLMQKAAKKIQEKLLKNPFSKENVFIGTREEIYKKQREFAAYLRSSGFDCLFLNEENLCDVYNYRPHDCRVHGCSYDHAAREVLGCFRFNDINQFKDPEVCKKLVDFDYLYPETRALDAALIHLFSKHPPNIRVWYFTTTINPILNDFQEINWEKVFNYDWKSIKEGSYVLILDY